MLRSGASITDWYLFGAKLLVTYKNKKDMGWLKYCKVCVSWISTQVKEKRQCARVSNSMLSFKANGFNINILVNKKRVS